MVLQQALSVSLLVQIKRRISNNHRGHLDIIADILDASCGGVGKTYLMYRCNLSFRQLKQYSGFLMSKGLLSLTSHVDNSSRGLFAVTDKGKEFLRAYKNLMALMN
jgi:predicted transcriptional regulator